MTDIVVLNRIRSQIISYLELVSSREEQIEYHLAAPKVHVPSEVINQWEDWVATDWRSYICEPVFTREEIDAVGAFYAVWDSVATATPDPLPQLSELWLGSDWQRLALAATSALVPFQLRGHVPEQPNEA